MNSQAADNARATIEQIWYRARINAYAHREANRYYDSQATEFFKKQLLGVLGSILSIILVYVVSQLNGTGAEAKADAVSNANVWSIFFTLLSIALTLYSLYKNIIASYLRLDVKAADHEHLLNQYQYLAQRAREVKWPDLPSEDVIALLRDLERDFQLLKATGSEPDDRHFEAAHKIVRKIREDKDIRIAQSFEVGEIDVMAQHVGDPKSINKE